jgi:hypothetical protein
MGFLDQICDCLRDKGWSFAVQQGIGRITLKVSTESGEFFSVVLHVREAACVVIGFFLYRRRCGPENCERMLTFLARQNCDLVIGGFSMDPEDGSLRFRHSVDLESVRLSADYVDHFVRMVALFGAKYAKALDAVIDGKPLDAANRLMG